ncbi:hypothetical protein VTO73DRAFT_7771 [Trametes versicolor]
MPPRKKFKSDRPDEIHEALVPLDPPALVLASGPVLWGMPGEILRLIALEMDLEDLYRLAQTCKDMRARLWCRSATFIWTDVMKVPVRGSGIAVPPSYLKVPEFIHLACSSHCYRCGAYGAAVFSPHMARVCSACLRNDPDTTVWYGDAAQQFQQFSCELSDAILSPATLSTYFIILDTSDDKTNVEKNRLLQRDVDRVAQQLRESGVPESNDDMKGFIATLKDICDDQREWSRRYHHALRLRREAKVKEDRKKRFDETLVRLRQNGWAKELDYLGVSGEHAISKLPYVRDGAERSGECPVEDVLLPRTRANLHYEEYRAVLGPRKVALEAAIVAHCVQLLRTSEMDIRPKSIDFVFVPECRAILELPRPEVVSPDHFAAIIPGLVQTWDIEVREQLTHYVRRHIGHVSADIDPLNLAVAVFACPDHTRNRGIPGRGRRRVSPMHYPSVLGHTCFRRTATRLPYAEEDGYERSITRVDLSYNQLAAVEKKFGWTQRWAPFDASTFEDGPAVGMAMQAIRRIVSALGLDPARATVDDLKACGGWLRRGESPLTIIIHHTDSLTLTSVPLTTKFEHEYAHTDIDPEYRALWQRVDQANLLVTIGKFEAQRDRVCDLGAYWACSLCPTFDSFGKDMKRHLDAQHGLTDSNQAIRDGTIYAHPLKTHKSRGRCIKSPLCDEHERRYVQTANGLETEEYSDADTEPGE